MHIDNREIPARWKGTGRNYAWFAKATATPRFPATWAMDVIQTLKELASLVSPALLGSAANAQGNGPVH